MKTAARDNCELVEHPEFETCSAIGARARIGLVVLATDYTIEHEFRRIINIPGVDVYQASYVNRLHFSWLGHLQGIIDFHA